ncbi:MAG: T9SS type A sorting domain-containing protein [Saprospiraceae bacterium]
MKKFILLLLVMCAFIDHSIGQPNELTISDADFFPEDIVIANNVAYVSGLGDGTLRSFDLTQTTPLPQTFAEAEAGYTQRWGLKIDGTTLLSLLNNADFSSVYSGPSKLVAYDIFSGQRIGRWDLPANTIGHTVSVLDGKYYVTDFGNPRILEVDPDTDTVNESWFTSSAWDPKASNIRGISGMIYDNDGGFYISQGNKLWYLPIGNGTPGTLQEVVFDGLDIIDAHGIYWVDSQNTLYYATNDLGNPANVGTVHKLVFSDVTTATASVIATDLDDASGLWYYEKDSQAYLYVLESQLGSFFGINEFEPPFNVEVISLGEVISNTENVLPAVTQIKVYPNPFRDVTTFEIELVQSGKFQLQIFDVSGKEVSNQRLDLNEGTNQFNYNGQQLTKGCYSYRLTNEQGFTSDKMIVIK